MNWYSAGANPLASIDGFVFVGDTCNLMTTRVEAALMFHCTLTTEQVAIASDLIDQGKAITGTYETWQHFAIAHGLEV